MQTSMRNQRRTTDPDGCRGGRRGSARERYDAAVTSAALRRMSARF